MAEKELIDYSTYNIFEMFGSFRICFGQSKKIKNKKINLEKQII